MSAFKTFFSRLFIQCLYLTPLTLPYGTTSAIFHFQNDDHCSGNCAISVRKSVLRITLQAMPCYIITNVKDEGEWNERVEKVENVEVIR